MQDSATDTGIVEQIVCSRCGLCCRLFLINLDEAEYASGEYLTVFDDLKMVEDFDQAADCGANLLAQQDDGSCIYLKAGGCNIHERRPTACREFFCGGNEDEFADMREEIRKTRILDKLEQ